MLTLSLWEHCRDPPVYHASFMPLSLDKAELQHLKHWYTAGAAYNLHCSIKSKEQIYQQHHLTISTHQHQHLHQAQILPLLSKLPFKSSNENNMPIIHRCPDSRKGNCRKPVKLFGVFYCPKHQTVCGMHSWGWRHLKRQSCRKCDARAARALSSPAGEQSEWSNKLPPLTLYIGLSTLEHSRRFHRAGYALNLPWLLVCPVAISLSVVLNLLFCFLPLFCFCTLIIPFTAQVFPLCVIRGFLVCLAWSCFEQLWV